MAKELYALIGRATTTFTMASGSRESGTELDRKSQQTVSTTGSGWMTRSMARGLASMLKIICMREGLETVKSMGKES